MAGKKGSDAGGTEGFGRHDVPHPDGEPPDEPVGIRYAQHYAGEHRMELLTSAAGPCTERVGPEAPQRAHAHRDEHCPSEKRNKRKEPPAVEEAAETENDEYHQ